jgi:hypothetical protein
MPENRTPESVAALERQILRALCSGISDPVEWDKITSQLSVYPWREPDHEVVYEAVRAIKSRDPKTRRAELPAQATRMGFPDLDWNLYFEPREEPQLDLRDLVRRLKAAALGRQ